MDFEHLCRGLKSGSPAQRKQHWKSWANQWRRSASEHGDHLPTLQEIDELRDLLLEEQDIDVRTVGTICLGGVPHLRASHEKFHHWLFHPFRHVAHEGLDSTPKHSLVLSVCDNEYVRDVQAQVELARYLPSDRYPRTVFRHVPLQSPDWADIGLDRADAICFLGRPSMFSECRIIDHFPRDLRFAIEGPDTSAGGFFHVVQNRPNAGPLPYQTTQDSSRRRDHAIIQRFVINVGGRNVTIVVVAGGSSLGTLGAAEWVTSFAWSKDKRTEFARLAGMESIEWSSRMEVLLSVSAKVHDPRRPWKPEVEERALFLNKSRNLLRPPSRILLATESGSLRSADDVRYLVFDDDEVELGDVDQSAALAVCTKYCLDRQPDIPIAAVTEDKRAWQRGACPVKGKSVTFFRDHLQRRSFNGIIEVTAQDLQLKLERFSIEVVRAGTRAIATQSGSP